MRCNHTNTRSWKSPQQCSPPPLASQGNRLTSAKSAFARCSAMDQRNDERPCTGHELADGSRQPVRSPCTRSASTITPAPSAARSPPPQRICRRLPANVDDLRERLAGTRTGRVSRTEQETFASMAVPRESSRCSTHGPLVSVTGSTACTATDGRSTRINEEATSTSPATLCHALPLRWRYRRAAFERRGSSNISKRARR